MVFDDPLDLTGRRLSLRTIVDPSAGDAGLRVRLTDGSGASVDLDPVGGTTVPALPSGLGLAKRWAQALVVDPSGASGIDLTQVVAVDLVSVSASGRVWVLDVASLPSTLAAVPETRLPLVDMSRLTVTEGDGPGTVEVQMPFTISGDLSHRASFTVGVVSYDPRVKPFRLPIDLAPGQTSGSVTLTYQANTLDDFARRQVYLFASPVSGVMTDRYLGRLTILDDDPRPTLKVTPVARSVAEGRRVEWKVALSQPLGYDSYVVGRVVRGPARSTPLRVGDVPRGWITQRAGEAPPRTPLYQLPLYLGVRLRAGQTSVTVTMPTRADGVREGRESVTLKVQVGQSRAAPVTVYVRD
jgi:hypothetical protein